MKLNHEQHGKGREVDSASGLQRSRRSLARARSQLTQAVGDVLSGALEGRRPGGGWLTAFGGLTPAPAPQAAERLREVVIRDRALFAANPRPLRTLAMDDLALEELAPDEPLAIESVAAAGSLSEARDDEDLFEDASLLEDEPPEVAPPERSAAPVEPPRPPAAKTKASAGRDAVTKPAGREPIRTRTMARLLAAQGHRGRALSIYEDLLARDDADGSLREEAEALRSQSD